MRSANSSTTSKDRATKLSCSKCHVTTTTNYSNAFASCYTTCPFRTRPSFAPHCRSNTQGHLVNYVVNPADEKKGLVLNRLQNLGIPISKFSFLLPQPLKLPLQVCHIVSSRDCTSFRPMPTARRSLRSAVPPAWVTARRGQAPWTPWYTFLIPVSVHRFHPNPQVYF